MTDREKALEEAAEGLIHMLQKLEARSDVSSDWRVSIRAALIEYKRALALPASASGQDDERNIGADIAAKRLRHIAETGEHAGVFGGAEMEAAAQAILTLRGLRRYDPIYSDSQIYSALQDLKENPWDTITLHYDAGEWGITLHEDGGRTVEIEPGESLLDRLHAAQQVPRIASEPSGEAEGDAMKKSCEQRLQLAIGLLENLEWSVYTGTRVLSCPACHAFQTQGHVSGCHLEMCLADERA